MNFEINISCNTYENKAESQKRSTKGELLIKTRVLCWSFLLLVYNVNGLLLNNFYMNNASTRTVVPFSFLAFVPRMLGVC